MTTITMPYIIECIYADDIIYIFLGDYKCCKKVIMRTSCITAKEKYTTTQEAWQGEGREKESTLSQQNIVIQIYTVMVFFTVCFSRISTKQIRNGIANLNRVQHARKRKQTSDDLERIDKLCVMCMHHGMCIVYRFNHFDTGI